MPPKKTTACVSLFVFFTVRSGTFPYRIEDDSNTTPTTHYTNTCVKLTIVKHLSFSERIAIANLSFFPNELRGRGRGLPDIFYFFVSCSTDHEQD